MILSIQYLRGLAAVLVLLHHTAFKLDKFSGNPLDWLTTADIGVDIFFVISGFVMSHSMRDRHTLPGAIAAFLLGRAKRILPLYWLLTGIGLLVFWIRPGAVNSSGGETDILASFLLIPTAGKYVINNGWTLSYEFYFYGIFALGLFWPRPTGRALVGTILVTLATIGLVVGPTSPWFDVAFSTFLFEFAAGIGLYVLYERGFALNRLQATLMAAAGTLGWLGTNLGLTTGLRIVDYGIPTLLFCVAVVAARPQGAGRSARVMHHLGDISYSLYLFHPFVLSLVTLLLLRLPAGIVSAPLAGLALVLSSVIASGWVYRLAEQPLLRFTRRIGPGTRAHAA